MFPSLLPETPLCTYQVYKMKYTPQAIKNSQRPTPNRNMARTDIKNARCGAEIVINLPEGYRSELVIYISGGKKGTQNRQL